MNVLKRLGLPLVQAASVDLGTILDDTSYSCDIDIDVDSVELFDDFRALKSSFFDDFRALKYSNFDDFRALKYSFFDDFRPLNFS